MAVIADRCPQVQVQVVDINQARIDAWNDADLGKLPVYEPGLDHVVERARQAFSVRLYANGCCSAVIGLSALTTSTAITTQL